MSLYGPTRTTSAVQEVVGYLGDSGRDADVVTAALGPKPPTWAVQQVGGYLGYSGCDAAVVVTTALDPNRSFAQVPSCKRESHNSLAAARSPQLRQRHPQ